MRILAIESSCDETGAGVLEEKNGEIKVLSNVLATSSDMHARTGGIIPENAAREQVKAIIPVIIEALLESRNLGDAEGGTPRDRTQAKPSTSSGGPQRQDPNSWEKANQILKEDIDAIAVTYGPGLIGSLLIGVEAAKTLSYALDKPLIPVNHLLAHIYANFISTANFKPSTIKFPFIGLIVSGGHTDLLYFESNEKFKWLGGTRDDASGEAIDKIGRMLNLPYPAGPEIERRANLATQPGIKFKSPLINSDDYDFSFSGLKSEVMRYVKDKKLNEKTTNEICYAVQKAVFDVIIKKTLKASEEYNAPTILIGGGVSANKTLLENMKNEARIKNQEVKIFSPEKIYATDNAAMIGAYALKNFTPVPWQKVESTPDLYFD